MFLQQLQVSTLSRFKPYLVLISGLNILLRFKDEYMKQIEIHTTTKTIYSQNYIARKKHHQPKSKMPIGSRTQLKYYVKKMFSNSAEPLTREH